MTSVTMTTIDRRARTSDGTDICSLCENIIPLGEVFTQVTDSDSGILLERNICADCQTGPDRDEFLTIASWIGAAVAVVGILALAFMG